MSGGGYGEIAADFMRELATRGHEVTMLVSGDRAAPGLDVNAGSSTGVDVRRELDYVLAPWRRPLAGLRAVRNDEQVVQRELLRGVDAAIVWHSRGIVKPPMRTLHEAGVPVFYMLHDRWALYERAGSLYLPWARLDRAGFAAAREAVGRALGPWIELRSPPIADQGIVCFVSRWLEGEYATRGWVPRHRHLVPCGVDVDNVRARRASPVESPPRRMLFAGRMDRSKGLHVAIEALARAATHSELTVAAIAGDARYERRVRARAEELGVAGRIRWVGEVDRDEVLRLLGEHDVLVYPSVGVEAYSLGLLEGFAAELVVVSSAPGGPREYLRHRDNSLVFEPGDSQELGALLDELASEPELATRLLDGARETASTFALTAVVDRFEALLQRATGRRLDSSAR